MSKRNRSKFIASDSDETSNNELEEGLKKLSKKSVNYSKNYSESSSDSENEEWNNKRKKSSKFRDNKKKRTKSNTSEIEEGEVTDSSASETFIDGLDKDLIGDDVDREALDNMNEVQRETELFNRVERREVLQTRFEIEKKLRRAKLKDEQRENDDANSSGGESGGSSSRGNRSNYRDSSPKGQRSYGDRRKNMDRRKESKHTSALEDLKLKREEKKKNSELLEKKAKLKASDVYSDDDDDDEDNNGISSDSLSDSDVSRSSADSISDSDSESDEKHKIMQMKMTPIKQLSQLSVIRLSRFKMEKWCHMPFFSSTIIGCYVRIGIGNSHGKPVYRVCEIIDVVPTGKVYQLGSTRTNKGIKLKYGRAERVYRLEFVSNTDFTIDEFDKWIETMALGDIKLPTQYDIELKQKQIKSSMNYTFNENDIQSIVESKKKFKKNPTNFALEKTKLMKARDMAEVEGDGEKKESIQKQMDYLEEKASELDRIRSKNISSVSYINQRNRQRNHVEAEAAAKQDYKDMQEYKQDPFTRRRCRPTLVTKTKEQQLLLKLEEERRLMEEQEMTGTSQNKSHGIGYTDMPEQKQEPSPKKDVSLNPKKHDLFSVHDFDITIDVQLPITTAMELSTKANKTNQPLPQRRSLNLSDYKKKKGLI